MLIHDVIFYKNLVYAIGSWNKIVSFDVNIDNLDGTWKSPNLKTVISAQYQREWGAVDDNDHLVRFTKNFKVYKLVLDDQSGELLEEKEARRNYVVTLASKYLEECGLLKTEKGSD
ncbi:hypothetical protein QQP08_016378 [Theobroma cacao]|nr:hypothetical protein QQP08_016378 [Theobroma cacao]